MTINDSYPDRRNDVEYAYVIYSNTGVERDSVLKN